MRVGSSPKSGLRGAAEGAWRVFGCGSTGDAAVSGRRRVRPVSLVTRVRNGLMERDGLRGGTSSAVWLKRSTRCLTDGCRGRGDGVTVAVGGADRARCDRGELRPESVEKGAGWESLEGGR